LFGLKNVSEVGIKSKEKLPSRKVTSLEAYLLELEKVEKAEG